MKVLMPTTEFPPFRGGVSTLAFEQAVGLAAQGLTVRVEAVGNGTDVQLPSKGAERLEVVWSDVRARAVLRILPLFSGLTKAAAAFKPDVFYTPTYRGYGIPLMAAAHQARRPFCVYLHGTEIVTESSRWLRRQIMRRVLNRASMIFVNSEHTAGLLGSAFPGLSKKTRVLPPAVDAARFADPRHANRSAQLRQHWLEKAGAAGPAEVANRVVLVSMSRMVRAKGIDLTLAALAELKQRRPDLSPLYVAGGGGPDLEYFQSRAAELGLDDRVLFAGPVADDDSAAFLKAGDFYVQPSQPVNQFVEGFGISFLEAHAAGLACIASDWGGIPEAVEKGKTALLVPLGDGEGLARAIEQLADSPELRHHMAQAGIVRARAMNYSQHAAQLADALRLVSNGQTA